jgi:glycerol-3-phosphate dehydrogenase
VVGGGINGTGIARDAAGRGLQVVLCEQDDLASHTSSASTKLVHGGLRYLEHWDFGLVRKSCASVKSCSASALASRLAAVVRAATRRALAPRVDDPRRTLYFYDHLAQRRLTGIGDSWTCGCTAGARSSNVTAPGFHFGRLGGRRATGRRQCDGCTGAWCACMTRSRCAAHRGRRRVCRAAARGRWHGDHHGAKVVNVSGAWVARFRRGDAGGCEAAPAVDPGQHRAAEALRA